MKVISPCFVHEYICTFDLVLSTIISGMLAGGRGATAPPAGNSWGAQKWKGGADPAPNFESEWEKTHSKKYSYFRQEKMCLYAYKQTKRIGDKVIY